MEGRYNKSMCSEGSQKESESRIPELEFVTFNGPSHSKKDGSSKLVRAQVMRDYLRKQNRQAITGKVESAKSSNPQEPSQYKGKFKLNTWTHKTRTKAINSRQPQGESRQEWHDIPPYEAAFRVGSNPLSILDQRLLDPFDSFSIAFKPASQRLLVYYHNSYSMNSVAINPEGTFFSQAKTDPAILHSILYLVSLHLNYAVGMTDSPESLYHGGEAFKLINQRIQQGVFSDTTIAAVAMLVTKENLNGRYDVSQMHMRGLEYMIKARGGVQELSGVLLRVVTWSDLCHANVFNIQPRFPRITLPVTISLGANQDEYSYLLPPEDLFGSASPIIPIVQSLRTLSTGLDAEHIHTADRLVASNMIYNTEYSLLNLNKENIDDLEPTSCIFSFESIPFRTASHLFLYHVIREIPPSSQILFLLAERLKDAIEIQLNGWWESTDEMKVWLLWMLFIGSATTAGRYERWWFVEQIQRICRELLIIDVEGLIIALKRVLWQEAWCTRHCITLWDDLLKLREGAVEFLDPKLLELHSTDYGI